MLIRHPGSGAQEGGYSLFIPPVFEIALDPPPNVEEEKKNFGEFLAFFREILLKKLVSYLIIT